ncbi:MAG: dehydrogenase E1 component subunit alpha/beta [Planctomycetota bacterium]|nr:dehydrogenase E1 component subunit alpha/beta [Planctomycetota bacterium]
MKNLDISPDFTPTTLQFGSVPCYRYQRNLADELAGGADCSEVVFGLRLMHYIRAFETTIAQLRSGQLVPYPDYRFCGATHLSVGQEAVAVGACAALAAADYITSTHRGHGHGIAKGAFVLRASHEKQLEAFCGECGFESDKEDLFERALELHLYRTMAEFLGKADGYCRGRGGGMHIADFHSGHLGANAIVGGSLAIATGAGMSMMFQGKPDVVLCFHGDGSVSNGIWAESVNMACMAQFKDKGVPVIYLIENNGYGMTGQTPGEVTGVDFLARRGFAYAQEGMHAEVLNGMDMLAVRDAVFRAAETCRKHQGPVLLEAMTYRFMGHSLSDQQRYRSKEEVEAWKAQDPILRLEAQLVEAGKLKQDQADELRQRVYEHMQELTIKAAKAAYPDPATLHEGLFSDGTSNEIPRELATTEYDESLVRDVRDKDGLMTYRGAVTEAMFQEMLRDRRVVFYGEDIAEHGGAFAATAGLYEIFGKDRVFNTAISEAAICGSAVGMALTGMRPVIELMYIDFILMSMDQIGNQAAKFRYMFGGNGTIPWTLRTTIGGGKGYAGQHSQSLEAVPAHIPGLKIVAPATPADAKGLLKTAIREDNPVIVIEHQLLYADKGVVPKDDYMVPLGKAAIRQEGGDVTIIAYSYMTKVALQAAKLLSKQAVEAEVIDLRSLVPLDVEAITASVRKTHRAVVVSQAPRRCSFAEHVAGEIMANAFDSLQSPVRIVAGAEVPPPMAPSLERAFMPDAENICQSALEMIR